jgi:hypothetical protein
MSIDLRPAKAAVAEGALPGHPGREALLVQPDEVDAATFDALFPSLIRLLRLRMEG